LLSLLFHQTKLVLKLSWINQFSFWKVKLSQINLVFQNLFKATSLKPDLESSFWFCKHFWNDLLQIQIMPKFLKLR
jgi:hypothetical protein